MPYSFRNREHIQAPQRFEDLGNEQAARRSISYVEPDIDEEMFASAPRYSRLGQYRGSVVHYNPNLPPAVFPTLDDSSRQARTSERPAEPLAEIRKNDVNTRLPTAIGRVSRPSKGTKPAWFYELKPHHDGTTQSIFADNIRRMRLAGLLSDIQRNILEMMSDEEEEIEPLPGDETLAGAWDELTTTVQLVIFDQLEGAHPQANTYRELRLDEIHAHRLRELLQSRNGRRLRENDDQTGRLNVMRAAMLGDNTRKKDPIRAKDYLQPASDEVSNPADGMVATCGEVTKGRHYLKLIGLNPRLLDGVWEDFQGVSQYGLDGAEPSPSPPSRRVDDLLEDSDGVEPSSLEPLRLTKKHRPPPLKLSTFGGKDGTADYHPSTSRKVGAATFNPTSIAPVTPVLSNPDPDITVTPPSPTASKSSLNQTPKGKTSQLEPMSGQKETLFLTRARRPGARQPKLTSRFSPDTAPTIRRPTKASKKVAALKSQDGDDID